MSFVVLHIQCNACYAIQLIEKTEAELADLKQQLADIKKGFEEHVSCPITIKYDSISSITTIGCGVERDKEDIGHS